jgi:hypothetical protein
MVTLDNFKKGNVAGHDRRKEIKEIVLYSNVSDKTTKENELETLKQDFFNNCRSDANFNQEKSFNPSIKKFTACNELGVSLCKDSMFSLSLQNLNCV